MNGRALLVSPLGFLIGISLGALGGGGSILAVPVLVYAAGESPKAATTTSLVVVGATALGGMFAHLRAGRVRVLPGIMFGLAGIGGSLVGTKLNHSVDPNVLLLAFAGLMLIAAWRMWVNQAQPGAGDEDFELYPEPPGYDQTHVATRTRVTPLVVAKVLGAGTVVGFITGFFGVGGGFVVVPALVLALGFDMAEAVGTSLLVIAINSAVALATRIGTTGIDWAVAAPFTIAGLLGVSVGKSIADRLPTVTLVRWFVGSSSCSPPTSPSAPAWPSPPHDRHRRAQGRCVLGSLYQAADPARQQRPRANASGPTSEFAQPNELTSSAWPARGDPRGRPCDRPVRRRHAGTSGHPARPANGSTPRTTGSTPRPTCTPTACTSHPRATATTSS